MFTLYYELSVLSRAVAYSNLSTASTHIGLSQPQLSRIILKIESQLKLTLLDREARRKSAWMPAAYRLAEVYSKLVHFIDQELDGLVKSSEPSHIKVGALEGMIPIALQYCQTLLQTNSLKILELEIHDLNRLEELFLKGDLALIFTLRMPGKKKYKFIKELGFQNLDLQGKNKNTKVLSTFEFGSQIDQLKKLKSEKLFVSNSLDARKQWLMRFGGEGVVPSQIYPRKTSPSAHPVYLIAQDRFSSHLWGKISGLLGS